MDLDLFVKALGAFFAIMNPFIVMPMFLALTVRETLHQQRRTALKVFLYSAVMATVVLLSGSAILEFFGISVSHFRVAGAIVLMYIGLGMLNGGSEAHEGTRNEKAQVRARIQEAESADETAPGREEPRAGVGEADVSFYPLAFPLILGPGTIATITVFAGQARGVPGNVAIVMALALVLVLLLVVLWYASSIGRRMSETLRVVTTRLMGMIVAAIAVAMGIEGLQELIPALR